MIFAVGQGQATLLYVVVIMALIYFLMIRPQKKQMNTRNEMLNNLAVGDHINTVGGINGYIRAIKNDLIYVEIADGLIIEMVKMSVAGLVDESIYDDPETVEEAEETVDVEEDEPETEEKDEK